MLGSGIGPSGRNIINEDSSQERSTKYSRRSLRDHGIVKLPTHAGYIGQGLRILSIFGPFQKIEVRVRHCGELIILQVISYNWRF